MSTQAPTSCKALGCVPHSLECAAELCNRNKSLKIQAGVGGGLVADQRRVIDGAL